MAITATPYQVLLTQLLGQLAGSAINVALLTSTYTPSDTHAAFSDINGEVAGAGYTAGGNTLTGVTVDYNAATKTGTLQAASTNWPSLNATVRYAVIYLVGSSAAASPLLGIIDFGTDRTYSVEPFELSFPSGLVTLKAL